MKVYNVTNFSRFFQSLDQCDDDLTLVMPDGNVYDWRSNRPLLLSLVQALDVERFNQMELQFKDGTDTSHVICYMMEGERMDHGCRSI